MPTNQSDALDDPLIQDGDQAFTLGQASAQQESAIIKSGFVAAQNMDFDPFGRLVTRRGAKTSMGNVEIRTWAATAVAWNADTNYWGSTLGSTTIDAACYFSSATTQTTFIAQGGGIKWGNETATFSSVAGATYTGSFVYFAQLGDRMYYCDGNGALAYVDVTNTNNAVSAGRITSVLILTQGQGYTSVPALTFSSGVGAATAVLGYGGRVISASVTTQGSGYSAITPPTVSIASAPSAGTTATARVNISQTPSKPKFLVAHTTRLFCTTGDTAIPADTLYASDFLDGESWDLIASSIRIGGDGDAITGICPWLNNNLIVFKQRSIYMVTCDPLLAPASWVIRLLSGRTGCVSHRSIQPVSKDIYFLAQDGVRALSQIEAGNVTDIGQPLSFPVQDVIDSISRTQQQYVCSAYYRNRYFLSIPTGTTPTITGCLVWNELTKSWMSKWTGWQPREFFVSGFSGKTRLNFADATGKLWTWDDYSNINAETSGNFRDDTADYESYVITRGYDCAEPMVDKQGHTVQIFTENRMTDAPLVLYAYYDKDVLGAFAALETALSISASDRQKRRTYNLLPKGKWNCIQFKVGTLAGRLAIVGISLTAFADNIKPELSS